MPTRSRAWPVRRAHCCSTANPVRRSPVRRKQPRCGGGARTRRSRTDHGRHPRSPGWRSSTRRCGNVFWRGCSRSATPSARWSNCGRRSRRERCGSGCGRCGCWPSTAPAGWTRPCGPFTTPGGCSSTSSESSRPQRLPICRPECWPAIPPSTARHRRSRLTEWASPQQLSIPRQHRRPNRHGLRRRGRHRYPTGGGGWSAVPSCWTVCRCCCGSTGWSPSPALPGVGRPDWRWRSPGPRLPGSPTGCGGWT